jgi:undecaprenyl phosphate N,N'-diacetylbacillosamine 1-phosphate transferase
MKRLIDICVSGGALLVLAPLLAVVALAVRITSPGPVLFLQRRLGRGGRPFRLWKFRSMQSNAPDIRNPDGSAFSSESDSRLTPIGRFLRQTSLDELPQLVNVLIGDMSLVGPRPDQVDQIRFYDGDEQRKLLVKPGITGLAQISGRNNIPWKTRKALDVQYVDRQSLGLDLLILLKTIPYVLGRKGIHTEANA